MKTILLFILGIPIFIITSIVGIIYTLVKHICKLDYSPTIQLKPILWSILLSFDGMANAAAGELFNDATKAKSYKYGNWNETISGVTGSLQRNGEDTKLRKILDKVLGVNHCIDAIVGRNIVFKNLKKE